MSDAIFVEAEPHAAYPVQVELMLPTPENGFTREKHFGLTVEEARELSGKLLAAVHEVEDARAVYVRVDLDAGTFTYEDPSGSLLIGDRVVVPFGMADAPRLGYVIGFGRGGYDGPTKQVIGRVETL